MNYFRHGFVVGLLVSALLFASSTSAENSNIEDSDLELTLKAINADKRKLFATNIEFSEKGKQAFWPIYDQYEKAMTKLNTKKVGLLDRYYNSISNKNLSGKKAVVLLKEYFSLEGERLKIKESYIAKFQKVFEDKNVARFFQLDNKVEAVINFDFARKVPLVLVK